MQADAQDLENPVAEVLRNALPLQRRAFLVHPVPSLAERRSDRQRLERFVRDNLQAIVEAISADFGHPYAHETVLLDVVRSLAGIGQCRQPQPAIGPWSR